MPSSNSSIGSKLREAFLGSSHPVYHFIVLTLALYVAVKVHRCHSTCHRQPSSR